VKDAVEKSKQTTCLMLELAAVSVDGKTRDRERRKETCMVHTRHGFENYFLEFNNMKQDRGKL
jgi:hypothetical protein